MGKEKPYRDRSLRPTRHSRGHAGFLLQVGFPLYLLAVFTVGRLPGWQRPIIWGGAAIVVLLWALAFARSRIKPPAPFIYLLLYVVWALIGLTTALSILVYAHYFRMLVQGVLLFLIWQYAVPSVGHLKSGFAAFLLIGLTNLALPGIVQTGGVGYGLAMETSRLTGHVTNPNALAQLFLCGIAGAIGTYELSSRAVVRIVSLTALAPLWVGVVLTASRSAALSGLVLMSVWYWARQDWGRHVFVSILAIALLVVSGQFAVSSIEDTYLGSRFRDPRMMDPNSPGQRPYLYKSAFLVFLKSPVFGVGLGQHKLVTEGLGTHSDYAESLASTGIVGFGLLMAAYLSLARSMLRARKLEVNPRTKRILAVLMGILAYLLFMGIFRETLYDPLAMAQMGLVCAGLKAWERQFAELGIEGAKIKAPRRVFASQPFSLRRTNQLFNNRPERSPNSGTRL